METCEDCGRKDLLEVCEDCGAQVCHECLAWHDIDEDTETNVVEEDDDD